MDTASAHHSINDEAPAGTRQDELAALVSADFGDSNELIRGEAEMLDRLIGTDIAKLFKVRR